MKKSTKWMKFSMMWITVAALMAVVAVLACGPASPAQQAGSGGPDVAKEGSTETPTPTTTPYPDDCKRKWNHIIQEWEVVCPEPGSRKIEHNLRREYNDHMEKKATRQARGETVEMIQRKVLVEVSTHDAVDALVDYLEARTTNAINGYKDPGAGGRVIGLLDIELLPAIAERDDVVEIDQQIPAAPASLMRQSSNPTPAPTMTAVERVRVDQWHDAGVTGAGVQVAVIDFDFRDFRTRVADPAVVNADPTKPDVHFFCYNAAGMATHTDFTFCETSHVNPRRPNLRPHGTDVVVALLENSPDATLLISNARDMKQLEQAVDWLTLGIADNSATDVDYNNACDASASDVANAGCNDAFDVKVINHSQTYIWDGPGDGTSTFVTRGGRSPINTSGDAVSRGVVWVNAAGNQNESTWFDHNPVFNVTGRLSYNVGGGGLPDCNSFTVDSSYGYTIQSRWSDDWDGADIDLDLEVYYLLGRVGISMDPQTGGGGHHPREFMTFPAGTLSSGTHCVVVSKDPGDPNDPNDSGEDVPDWIQVQIFAGPGDFAHSSRDPGYSISNPAESANPGLLAVGAASNEPTPALRDFSARGPIPSTGNPVKPDVVGLNTDLPGTSFSSPRVAGEVALVVQGGGNVAPPTRVAAAMKEHAEHPSSPYPDQEWGHGLSKLPSLEAPAIASVIHDPCSRQGALRVDYSHPAVGTHPMAFYLKAQQVSAQGTGAAAYEQTHIGTIRNNPREVYLDTGTDRGSYDVTARACTEAGHCGPESSPAMRFATTAKVCDPRWFRAVPGDEKATLWWNPDPDATGYKIQLVGGDPDYRYRGGTRH